MANQSQKKNVSMQQVITALLDESNLFPPAYLRHFSDLEGHDLAELRRAWPQVTAQRRFLLLGDLEDLAEVDTLVSFDNLAQMALKDEDARVRTVAIRLLWESEDPRIAKDLMALLEKDPSPDVRAAAATGLGTFVYQGELEELDETLRHGIEDQLLSVVQGQDEVLVRRRALESLGFSGRSEVPGLIRKAYDSGEVDWMVSALFAMGRSADNAWDADVKRMLRHPKAEVQFEAVRAAGELSIESARRVLLDLLEEEAQDTEIRQAAIWSLSQIGGEQVRETLETLLEETEDEEEAELLENALDNLSFTEDVGLYSMFDIDELTGQGENLREYFSEQDEAEYRHAREAVEDDETGDDASSRSAPPPSHSESGRKRHRHHKS
jgi:HEAT repeat protein